MFDLYISECLKSEIRLHDRGFLVEFAWTLSGACL